MSETITLPWPDPNLSPNARVHFRVKADSAKQARETGYYLAKEQKLKVPDVPLHVWFTFYPPDKRHRDVDNMLSSMKSTMDGIFDAVGVNDERVQYTTIARGDVFKGGKVIVSIAPAMILYESEGWTE